MVAVMVKLGVVVPVKVPDSTPDGLNVSPGGKSAEEKDWIVRPLVVVTINWWGVSTLFWKKVGVYAAHVKVSSEIVNRTVWVAKDPHSSVAVNTTGAAGPNDDVGIPATYPVVGLRVKPYSVRSTSDV